jgi:Chaperone of endosialidase
MSTTITQLADRGSVADNTYFATETAGVTNRIVATALRNYVFSTTVTSVAATTGTFTYLTSTTDYAANFSSANAQIIGGNVTGLTYLSATNFSTGNAQITGGNLTGITTLNVQNLIASNASIGGNGNITAGNIVGTLYGNVIGATGQFSSNVSADYFIATRNAYGINAFYTGNVNATNFNGVHYGAHYGSAVGVTAAYTGAVSASTLLASSTVTAATVNAATIGNLGTTLTGTLTTNAQPNITSVGTLTAGAIGTGFTAIPNSALANTSVTVNGTSVSLGGSATVTANATTLTGTVLATGVVTSSLTTVGTITNLRTTSLGVNVAASGTAGEIRATDNITAFYTSDVKFKENITTVPDALAIVTQIGSKLYDWTDAYITAHGGEDGYFVQKSDFGVIAQDVQRVFPQAVRTRPDGALAVDYEKLATLSFGAIGQLLDRVEALEAAVTQLTSNGAV